MFFDFDGGHAVGIDATAGVVVGQLPFHRKLDAMGMAANERNAGLLDPFVEVAFDLMAFVLIADGA